MLEQQVGEPVQDALAIAWVRVRPLAPIVGTPRGPDSTINVLAVTVGDRREPQTA